jgi:hypothetical protein
MPHVRVPAPINTPRLRYRVLPSTQTFLSLFDGAQLDRCLGDAHLYYLRWHTDASRAAAVMPNSPIARARRHAAQRTDNGVKGAHAR